MSKTAPLSEEAHMLIVEKQLEILKKYGVNVRIYDILDVIVRNYISEADRLLGFKGNERIENFNRINPGKRD